MLAALYFACFYRLLGTALCKNTDDSSRAIANYHGMN
jgi:hypothetical protein